MAFWLERCLPRPDLGPLECFELLRFAATWASEGLDMAIVVPDENRAAGGFVDSIQEKVRF